MIVVKAEGTSMTSNLFAIIVVDDDKGCGMRLEILQGEGFFVVGR